jgi:hypothetical protein
MWQTACARGGKAHAHTQEMWQTACARGGKAHAHTQEMWQTTCARGGKAHAHTQEMWQTTCARGGKAHAHTQEMWQTACSRTKGDTPLKPYEETTYSRVVATFYLEKPKTRAPEYFFDQAVRNTARFGLQEG